MPSLAELSEQRIAAGLDSIVAGFAPGASLPEQLVAGRNAALQVLRIYVPGFAYDVGAADAQMRQIDAWAERNSAALGDIMSSSAEQLPEQLRLQMGSERAQSWILSSFTQAAAGLGPWTSGAVSQMASRLELINERWARADAAQRLDMFALIVKLERDGALRAIFVPPPGAASGFGALPVWAIVVVIVALAAALVTGVVLWRRIELNNRLMRDICERAYADHNEAIVAKCIEATRDLQVSALERATQSFARTLSLAMIATAAVYAGLRWGLPWLASRRQRTRGGDEP